MTNHFSRLPRRAATVILGLALLGNLATWSPAAAAIPATVRVAEGYYPASAQTAPITYRSPACKVAVGGSPATALGGLQAARSAGCVRSFKLTVDERYGHYLRCIDERCETTGFYWAIYVNSKLACTGLDGIRLKPNDELAFSYENYATAVDLVGC